MTIQYSLLLPKLLPLEHEFKEILDKHHVIVNSITEIPKGKNLYTSDFFIAVIDTSDLPYGWDCEITQEEYKYDQSISFRLNKSSVTEHIASQILTIVLSITESVGTALFLLNDSTVFYWDKNTLLINNAYGYWDIGDRIKIVSKMNFKCSFHPSEI